MNKNFDKIENALGLKRQNSAAVDRPSGKKIKKKQTQEDQEEINNILDTGNVQDGIQKLLNDTVDDEEEEQDQEDEEDHEEEDPILHNMSQLFEEGKYGPPINQQVADIMIKLWDKDIENKILKEKMQKYETPQNLEKLKVPKVNDEIYEGILKSFESPGTLNISRYRDIY